MIKVQTNWKTCFNHCSLNKLHQVCMICIFPCT
jgi:hypothetical protein